jgi:hypothetical protein
VISAKPTIGLHRKATHASLRAFAAELDSFGPRWASERGGTTADEEGTGMAVNVCPADRVQASVDVVWELLMHPAGYGGFWDMTVERVEPEGPAAVGQRFFAWTLCRRLRIDGEILEVDAVRHAIRFRTTLPFGLVGDNRIACSPIDAGSCMLRYG